MRNGLRAMHSGAVVLFLLGIGSCLTNVLGAEIAVNVGKDGLWFSPSVVVAQVGDIVSFFFWPGNHTLIQTTFGAPCVRAVDPATGRGGVDSGFVPVTPPGPGATPVRLNVTTPAPLWFACLQTGHCERGEVFAINPTPDRPFATFQATAMGKSIPSSSTTSSSTSSPFSNATPGTLTTVHVPPPETTVTSAPNECISVRGIPRSLSTIVLGLTLSLFV